MINNLAFKFYERQIHNNFRYCRVKCIIVICKTETTDAHDVVSSQEQFGLI